MQYTNFDDIMLYSIDHATLFSIDHAMLSSIYHYLGRTGQVIQKKNGHTPLISDF